MNAAEVYIQHMWPQALSVPTVKCLKTHCLCVPCVQLTQFVLQIQCFRLFRLVLLALPVLVTTTRVTCSALCDTHSLSLSLDLSVSPHPSSQLPPNLNCFNLTQLNTVLNALLSLCLFFCLFSLSVAVSSLFAIFFICATLATSQNSPLLLPAVHFYLFFILFSLSFLSVAFICPHHLCLCLSPFFLSFLQLKYYKCYCVLAGGQISKVINQYSERIM